MYLEAKGEFFDSFKISHPNLKIAEQRWKKVVEQNICSSNDTELFDAVGQAIKKEITDDLLIGLEDKIQKQSDTNNLKKRLYSITKPIY